MAKKPTANSHPTLLTGPKATNIPALDAYFYSRWPHLFEILERKHKPPDHFMVVLRHVWCNTVGSSPDGMGDISLSQIPVRHQERDKWLAAFVACRFWEVVKAKHTDRSGSMYIYRMETTAEEWERLFVIASRMMRRRRWDRVSKERFAESVRHAFDGGTSGESIIEALIFQSRSTPG